MRKRFLVKFLAYYYFFVGCLNDKLPVFPHHFIISIVHSHVITSCLPNMGLWPWTPSWTFKEADPCSNFIVPMFPLGEFSGHIEWLWEKLLIKVYILLLKHLCCSKKIHYWNLYRKGFLCFFILLNQYCNQFCYLLSFL